VYKPTDDKKVYFTEDVSNIGLNKIQTHFVAIINTNIVFFINRSSFGDGYFIQSQSELISSKFHTN